MSTHLTLKQSCFGCGSTAVLYGSSCEHLTLCVACGETMVMNQSNCYDCGIPITDLILGVKDVKVTEEELRAFLVQKTMTTSQDLVTKFKNRLKSKEERVAFVATLRRISKIHKINGVTYVALSGPVTKEEIRAILLQKTDITTKDLVDMFKTRLKSKEARDAFTTILRTICKIRKTSRASYVVLRKRYPPVTEEKIRSVLLRKTPVTTQGLVAEFKSRLKSQTDKEVFAAMLRRIARIQKVNGAIYVTLLPMIYVPLA